MSLEAIATHPALAGMRRMKQWLVYALANRPGETKAAKVPLSIATGKPTSVNDPESWTDFESAAQVAHHWGAGFGVGFCFTEAAGYWFIDLDSCFESGTWSPLALQVVSAFPGAALEVSSSGTGLHLFGRGAVPPHTSKNIPHHAEFYTADRFVALSGTSLQGDCDTDHSAALAWLVPTYFPPRDTVATHGDGPRPEWNGPTDDDDLIRRAMQSRSARSAFGGGAAFADLWAADAAALARAYPHSSEPFDRSSADAALAQHLAFWTGCDAERIDRLMRQSALVRTKYDREDYLPRTIANACAMQREVLQDKPAQPGPLENLGMGEVPADTPQRPQMQPVTGSTFLGPAEQVKLFEGCVYIVDLHRALIPGGHLVNPDRFRAIFGGYTFAMDARNERTSRNAWEAFTESQVLRAPRADGVCFRPQLPYAAMVRDAGRVRANTWWPVDVPRKAGNAQPFVDHVRKLAPHDWRIVLSYLAALVQKQGTKFQWAVVLQGVEGNGKTLLSRCAAEAIGRRYVHWPKASKLSKDFNAWMVGRTFFAVEDIHTSENTDVIEQLKPMITGGDGLEIEGKGVDQISAEICGNFFFNSNHRAGLRKTRNDRRYCIVYCAQQTVDDLARDGMAGDYMQRMYDWLQKEDGYAIVSEFLWTYPIDPQYDPSGACQRAPRTTSTDEAIAQSLGRIEQEILEAVAQDQPGFCGGWISSIAVDKLIDRMGRGGSVPPNRRREMMQSLGYDWHPHLPNGRVHNIVAPDAAKPRLYVRSGHAALALTSPAEIARAYAQAQGAR